MKKAYKKPKNLLYRDGSGMEVRAKFKQDNIFHKGYYFKDNDFRPGKGGAVFIYAFIMALIYLLIFAVITRC
jgi:hypothetical protein